MWGDTPGTPATSELVLEIVETLEARGLARDAYTLYDTIDPDALATVLAATDGLTVRFSVEGVLLSVTPTGVTVFDDDRGGPVDEAGGPHT